MPENCTWSCLSVCKISTFYVYVTTWSAVDYTSVTSIMHCRPCCNKLISLPSQTLSVTANRIGVGHVALGWSEFRAVNWIGEDAINMTGFELQWTCWTCWQRLLLFVERSLSICESSFDLQFSLYDISDDENAVNVKDKAFNQLLMRLSIPSVTAVCKLMIRFSYFITYFRRLCFTTVSGVL